MDDFAKMDVFFIVTTCAVGIVGALSGLILYRIWQILGEVSRFAKMMNEEAALMRKDVAHLRANVAHKGFRMKYVVRFFKGAFRELFRGDDD